MLITLGMSKLVQGGACDRGNLNLFATAKKLLISTASALRADSTDRQEMKDKSIPVTNQA